MNKSELKRGAQWLRDNVKPERFDMDHYRSGSKNTHICDSVGCAVGWLTGSVPEENIDRHRDEWGYIHFERWSKSHYDLEPAEWRWCFSDFWTDRDNTLEGAALRMEWLAEHGLPSDWRSQVYGFKTLCYLP